MKTMNIPFSPPDITDAEIAEVVDTLRSGWITTGPKTKLFEKQLAEYCHTSKAVCLNSATACEELALRTLGVGPEDEVITTAYTYTASASVVCHVGAKLVLVDTQKDTYEMDYEELEKRITGKTKAIIAVDLGGVVCDYGKIYEIVERKKDLFRPANEIQEKLGRVAVLADGAHSLGAMRNGKRCGEIADFTTFSFHAVKNLTTAEGGALVWKTIEGVDDEKLYNNFMLLSLHGQSKDALTKTKLGSWEYDIVAPYYKYNMTDIMASLGLAQLKRYPDILKRRKEIIEKYNKGLEDAPVKIMEHYNESVESSGHLYIVRAIGKTREKCNEIIMKMAEKGITTNVHYKPLPMFTAYKNLGFDIKDYPNAYALFENEITLPLHAKLTDEQVDYIIENFKECLE